MATTDDRKLPSGYTEMVAPDRLTPQELSGLDVVPVASESGRQEGHTPPAQIHSKVNYETLTDLDEVKRRLQKRVKGEIPPIQGPITRVPGPVPANPAPELEPDELDKAMDEADLRALEPVAAILTPPPPPPAPKRTVGFTTSGGTYMVPVLDVVQGEYGLLVDVVTDGSQPVFIPTVGAELQLSIDGGVATSYYYPGTRFRRGNIDTMVFVSATQDKQSRKVD